MNKQHCLVRPVKSAVVAFMALMVAAVAVALTERIGLLDGTAAKRGLGLVIGITILIIGNYLPKLRPLNAARFGDAAKAAAAERFAGRVLVLSGIAWTISFAFLTPAVARPAASIIGITALAIIAADWMSLAQGRLFGRRAPVLESMSASERGEETSELMAWLLFAFVYVFATACITFLFDGESLGAKFVSSTTVAFTIGYAVLYAVSNRKGSFK